ncbi:MAG: InlB B-repeat-containing protein [Paludibacteraceae bacterium]|nr:InlB B-repeat-containing protein [Paludibacteraceae bacterium]MBQ8704726.1 InlB B-repeat-containing protein [Paludibacteraceae bacterium]
MRKIFTLFIAALCCAGLANATEGALPGKFTINENGDQIRFAKGNLQYQESTDTWRFAENQTDTLPLPSVNEKTGEYTPSSQWIDRISLSKFSSKFEQIYYDENEQKYKIKDYIWHILPPTAWEFIISGRANAASLHGAATVGNTEGFVLLPDNWQLPQGVSFKAGGSTTQNVYSAQQWNTMENAGAVFLPFTSTLELYYQRYKSYPDEDIFYDLYTIDPKGCYPGAIKMNNYGYYTFEFIQFSPDGTAQKKSEEARQCFMCEGGDNSPHPQWNLETNSELLFSIRPVTEVTSSTVTFKDWDGTVLKTEKLEQGADATAPADPVREGYTFVGWDAGFTNVQSDMTVTAIYSKPLTGRFSVAADKQIIFAQGNLQYKASDNKWAFSDKQYDMIGSDNAKTSASYKGWIDLFGWGTASNPTETSKESAPYTSFTDWTTNTIENADGKTWYTMPEDEWNYLLSTRADAASKQGQAVVNEVKGYILLPDNWTLPAGLTFTATPYNYTTNIYTASEWEKLEAAGAVFLPAAGFRYGIEINGLAAGNGYYWTPTPSSQYDDMAQALMISEYSKAKVNFGMPCYGYSVRPVREVQASEGIDPVTGSPSPVTHKLLRNGVLLIERNGKTYNAQGAEVR